MHDFVDPPPDKAIPYGVGNVVNHASWVNVGINWDTAAFAVERIRRWWQRLKRERYPGARKPLITAECGGSNGSRARLWKVELQKPACELGVKTSVCHLPPEISKP